MLFAGQIRHQLNQEGDILATGNHKRCVVHKVSNLVAGVEISRTDATEYVALAKRVIAKLRT